MTDIQKASIWKRASAGLFDLIITISIAVGFFYILSMIFKYDNIRDEVNQVYIQYEEKYGFNFLEVSEEMYNNYTEEQKANYDAALEELYKDTEYLRKYNLVINLALLMTTGGILLGLLLVELVVPLIFKNGQTLGKKVFSIGLIRADGIRIKPINLFARTVLGKFTIEIMIPVYIVIMFVFQSINLFFIFILVGLALIQIVVFVANSRRPLIHDLIAYTVVIDMNSQMIFDTEEQKADYIANQERVRIERQSKIY